MHYPQAVGGSRWSYAAYYDATGRDDLWRSESIFRISPVELHHQRQVVRVQFHSGTDDIVPESNLRFIVIEYQLFRYIENLEAGRLVVEIEDAV